MEEIKIKDDKDWLIGILERQIKRYKEMDEKKHNHKSRIKLLQKTIKIVETDFSYEPTKNG